MHRTAPGIVLIVGCMAIVGPTAAEVPNAPPPPPPTSAIVVHDESMGCFHLDVKHTEFTLQGDRFVGPAQSFPESYIDGLREMILASHEDSSGLLAQVGFTPESVLEHRDLIYRAIRHNLEELPEEIPDWAEPLLAYDRLLPLAFDAIAGPPGDSTTNVVYSVLLPGYPPVTVRSTCERPWMLPWTVTAGDRTWETYSLQISKALGVLADPTGPNAPLLDGTGYWSDDFWSDVLNWGDSLTHSVEDRFSRMMCAALAGYDDALQEFVIDEARIGWINAPPRSLFVQLHATNPKLIDAVWWWNLLQEKRPTHDWNHLLAKHHAATVAAEPHAWLAAWKHVAPGRTISLAVVGARGFSEPRLDREVTSTWKALGLAGQPEFELRLYEPREYRATLFLGTQEPRALIIRLKRGAGDHWLDHRETDSPWCLLVDRQGHVEEERIVHKPEQ